MIYSMTGFGKSERIFGSTSISVEMRSVNNRFLDLSWKSPRSFVLKENEVREFLKRKLDRGKITVSLTIQSPDVNLASFKIDHSVFQQYASALREAAEKAGIAQDVRLEHLLQYNDIFVSNNDAEAQEALWKNILTCIDEALDEMNRMRRSEGTELANDFIHRLETIETRLDKITELSKTAVTEELEKLRERVKLLLERTDFDPQRLDMELAILADKVDITEELVRFRSHNKMFRSLVEGKETQVGRKLNFIVQEMGRETNTIGSKSSQSEVIHTVVSIKEELEKIREQIQNVE
ncbi:YicC family protein [bacterium]|nr:YicC family protein [bacterium]NUN46525.1 YicC family protein [bacterium]HMV26116.1 YicC family protein [bacterium]